MGQLLALQLELRESRNGRWQDPTFLLNVHGSTTINRKFCTTWPLNPLEDITSLVVRYGVNGVTQAQFYSNQRFLSVGVPENLDLEGSFTFNDRYKLIGLKGVEDTYIRQISAIATDTTCDPNPRPPVAIETLQDVPTITDSGVIGLSWRKVTSGSDALDYQIWYDQGTGQDFVLLDSGITDL